MEFAQQVKCVVWDLDDTLWDGILADDRVVPRRWAVEMVKRLDERGIINSICSKNHAEQAKNLLQRLGIRDYFVFPVIDFIPKGQNVKTIVENMQLRPQNVLFVDDSVADRREVQHYCPDVMVGDPNDPGFQTAMEELIERAAGSSRLAQCKILEAKHVERQQYFERVVIKRATEKIVDLSTAASPGAPVGV